MEALLPYYERELGFLRGHAREFAERYPKIAGRLQLAGELCEDPHTERMIESFALLNARIAKRLDDDYPQFTEALLDVLYPHYLRPFPSCSIARLPPEGFAAQSSGVTVIGRGLELESRKLNGTACTFRTAYAVTLAPLALTRAAFTPILALPEYARTQAAGGAGISITLACTGAAPLSALGLGKLRVFIDGEPSFCAALRDALFMRTVAAYVQGDGHWQALDTGFITPAGFDDEDALIELPARSHPAYRLLTEYFCYPEKFNFFDIDVAALCGALPAEARSATVHLALAGLRSDSDGARILAALSANKLLLGCTPVVNLFRRHSDPMRLTHTSASYPLLADSGRSLGCVVHAVDTVHMTRQSAQGESLVQFQPFYSLRHGQSADNSGHYWVLRRNEDAPVQAELTIVDIDFDPAQTEAQTLSVALTCSNGDLPSTLGYGQPGGDLFGPGGSMLAGVPLLRKPSASYRFECGNGGHWRLISHLALNHLSLADGGVDALREMLTLYDLPRSAATQRQIGGIAGVAHRAVTSWLAGNPFACLVRGTEVRLTIDEEAFVGSGIDTFAHVIERFLGLYAHTNSFAQLVIVSNKSGEALLTLKPRSGDLNLL